MKNLSPELKAHLETGATTLCQCWLVERLDGQNLGFTDHDDVVVVDGITYQPETGFTASEAASQLGLGVTTSEVDGALSSDVLTRDDLHSGVFDNAKVTVRLVNWEDATQNVILRTAELGEVTSKDGVFSAELRGLMHRLSQVQGRLFEVTCDADVGDSRCKVDLSQPAFAGAGGISRILDAQSFEVAGLDAFTPGWFERGLLSWTSGENAGQSIEIDGHRHAGSSVILRLWLPPVKPLEVGSTFDVTAGCNKLVGTCQAKFANVANFRGFPHIPGSDTAFRVARADGRNTGRPIIS